MFIAGDSTATYISYFTVGKIMIKHQSMLRLFMKLRKDDIAASTVCITYLGKKSLPISSEENVFFMIQTPDDSLKND